MQVKTIGEKYNIGYDPETNKIMNIRRYTENMPGLRRELGVQEMFETYMHATKGTTVVIDKTDPKKHILTDENGVKAVYEPDKEWQAEIYINGTKLPEVKYNIIMLLLYDTLAAMGDY